MSRYEQMRNMQNHKKTSSGGFFKSFKFFTIGTLSGIIISLGSYVSLFGLEDAVNHLAIATDSNLTQEIQAPADSNIAINVVEQAKPIVPVSEPNATIEENVDVTPLPQFGDMDELQQINYKGLNQYGY